MSYEELSIIAALDDLRARGWTLRSVGAGVGVCGGFFVGIAGCALTALSWFIGAHWHSLPIAATGTVLLILTIPLLLFGGHCLDLCERKHVGGSTSKESVREVRKKN